MRGPGHTSPPSNSNWTSGCRCDGCRIEHRTYNTAYRERKRQERQATAERELSSRPPEHTEGERWLPIPGHAGYEASDQGHIRSLDRLVAQANYRSLMPGRILKPWYARQYLYISLGHSSKAAVHVLVCKAFHGEKPSPDLQVRHLNGNCEDNRPENLTWGTVSENHLDKVRHGTNPNANKTRCPNGHEYDTADKYGRRCSICRKAYNRAYYLSRLKAAERQAS